MERSIVRTYELDVSLEAVFRGLTTVDVLLRAWPLREVELQPRVGGKVVLRGEGFTDHGEVLVFDPPTRFAYRYWSTNHGTPREERHLVRIEYSLESRATGCRLEVRHSNLPSDELLAVMPGVWDDLIERLKVELGAERWGRGGAGVDP